MVIDTSAVVAILNGEDDSLDIERRLMSSDSRRISAANHVELSLVVARGRVPEDLIKLDRFLDAAGIAVAPVTAEDARIAREAFLEYGKGRHPAKLNFGDCFAYALAKRLNEPLLFKGSDFSQTDVEQA